MPYLDIHSGRWTEAGPERVPVLLLKTEKDSFGIQVIQSPTSPPVVGEKGILEVLKAGGLSEDPAVIWLYHRAIEALFQGRFSDRCLTELELYEAFAERVHL